MSKIYKYTNKILEAIQKRNRRINANIRQTTDVTETGQKYFAIAKINIPKINCKYGILCTIDSEYTWTQELLGMSPCYFWGAEPNKVGNFCIAGHNYRNTRFFSKVPTLKNGDKVEITDLGGNTVKYAVYDKYRVNPDELECTSQLTNGKKEVTLITCTNDNKKRYIIKAREV